MPFTIDESREMTLSDCAGLVQAAGDTSLRSRSTSLRWGEVAALKLKRVGLERHRLDVAEAVSEPEGTMIWGTPKNHERRSVPFPGFHVTALASRVQGRASDDLVFGSPKSEVLRSGNFRCRRFDAAVIQLRSEHPELPKITPHSLCHSSFAGNFRRRNRSGGAADARPRVRVDDARRL